MIRAVATMRTAVLCLFACGSLLATPVSADDPSIPRIGLLIMTGTTFEQSLRENLRELGYVDGKNIVIVSRPLSSQTDEELRAAVANLAGSQVRLLVSFSTPAARIALQTTDIPVVFAAGDPVGDGLAASLARPEGRGTGVSLLNREMAGKRIELLRKVAPGIRRIVFLMNPSNPLDVRMLQQVQAAARALGLDVIASQARDAHELDMALHTLPKDTHDGLLISNDLSFIANRARVGQAARRAKLPAVFPFKGAHDDDALMSYGPTTREAERKVAAYVDKILKGAKPSELPIEQISTIELVIDLRVAKAMGIHMPQDLLLRADEVIR